MTPLCLRLPAPRERPDHNEPRHLPSFYLRRAPGAGVELSPAGRALSPRHRRASHDATRRRARCLVADPAISGFDDCTRSRRRCSGSRPAQERRETCRITHSRFRSSLARSRTTGRRSRNWKGHDATSIRQRWRRQASDAKPLASRGAGKHVRRHLHRRRRRNERNQICVCRRAVQRMVSRANEGRPRVRHIANRPGSEESPRQRAVTPRCPVRKPLRCQRPSPVGPEAARPYRLFPDGGNEVGTLRE